MLALEGKMTRNGIMKGEELGERGGLGKEETYRTRRAGRRPYLTTQLLRSPGALGPE